MDVLKKHYETLKILGGMAALLIGLSAWINGRFESVNQRFSQVNEKFSQLDSRLVRIETVLLLRGVMPIEMAVKNEKKKELDG